MNDEGIIQIGERKTSGNWNPVQGPVLTRFLGANTSLSNDEKNRLVSETLSIMRQCVDPKAPGSNNTGLIIGHVQSGKTLSFTSLSALAQDNDYQIVLLLAGTTNNLVEQSFERLKRDLEIEKNRTWKLFSTQEKGFQKEEVQRVQIELDKWHRRSPRARTVLIVCMKHHQHIQHLASLLTDIDLESVPTLIIDDEGDQAGMNTKALTQEVSTTHARIKELRRVFPNHSYLLYTATPQAPLLISRIDTLSPDFGVVLKPGNNYVGGKEFFIEGVDKYIKFIPITDVPDRDVPPTSPPLSMLRALKDFFVGVAIGMYEKDYKDKNRSMMIHPAISTGDHLMFVRWARNIQDEWVTILRDPDHPGYDNLLEGFCDTFDQLTETYTVDCDFNQIKQFLSEAVSETAIIELNTRKKAKISSVDWSSDYSWILVGGIGLDRGFTVEGLTVSYMPRSIGSGNVDSIQQRARFFGYKKSYLGLCRIYLTEDNIDAFEDYVSHEESVRQSISQNIKDGKTLKDWRRSWVLNRPYKPTRSSVVLLDMYESWGHKEWIYPDYPYQPTEFVDNNREVADEILEKFDFSEYKEDGWTKWQTIPAFSNNIPLGKIIPLIGQFRYQSPNDSLQHSSIMLLLEKHDGEAPDMQCSVYAFSGPWCGINAHRSLNNQRPPKIKSLFQGRNDRTSYPGARQICSPNSITFQIHRYHLKNPDKSRILLRDLPVLAVNIPRNLNERIWLER